LKTSVPESIKNDLPPNRWGKILGTTPVVLTVVATLLAGLASSEMTRAQYDRSYAAQLQAKAGDQWSYFQAKKLRSALQHGTLDLLESTTEVRPFDPAGAQATVGAGKFKEEVWAALARGGLKEPEPSAPQDPTVVAAIDGLHRGASDEEMMKVLTALEPSVLEAALRSAQTDARAFDTASEPILKGIDAVEASLAGTALRRDYTAARMRVQAQRYDIESDLNRSIGSLYELQVRKNNLSAERHHRRSERFFFGMLAAQAGVVLSTLAMAAQRRSLLWAVAACAGSIAIAFAVYVYLFV
jgi:hypothetical protein